MPSRESQAATGQIGAVGVDQGYAPLFALLRSLDPSAEAANYRVAAASKQSIEAWDIEGLWSDIRLAQERSAADQKCAEGPELEEGETLELRAAVELRLRSSGARSSTAARMSSGSTMSDLSDFALVRAISPSSEVANSPLEAISPSDLAMVRALFDDDIASHSSVVETHALAAARAAACRFKSSATPSGRP